MLGLMRYRPGYARVHLKYIQKDRKYSKLSYVNNPGTEPFRPLTIGKLLEQTADKYGDRKAIISRSQNQSLTFQEVLEQADKLAAGLNAIGLNVGDRIGIWAPNIIEWYITYMACARGGYILVNINPAYQPPEMHYCINRAQVKSIICSHKYKSQNYYDILTTISPKILQGEPGKLKCEEMPSLENIIISSDQHLKGTFSFKEIFDLSTRSNINIQKLQDSIDPDDICHIQFTSGTTGKAKAPMQTHFHLVTNSYYVGKRNELDRKHHKICVQVPFFHVFGTVVTITAALNHGATLVLPAPSFNPDKSLDALRDEKCTIIYGTPTMYVDLIDKQKKRKEDISLEIAASGGAPCSQILFKDMKEILKVKKVKSVFGMTETTAVIFQSLYDDDEYQSTATVGYLQDHLEAKIIDTEGKIVPRGTPGELCIRGYCTTAGYWKDDDKTRELINVDGWLKTGDQFVLEENGYGRIIGRIKELIIRGGENIYPKEIEDLLNTHPHILETYVVGLPHERLGEEVCACIRVQEDTIITLDGIRAHCKGQIAHFKIPTVLKIVDSFPKTTSGKVQKFRIIESITINK